MKKSKKLLALFMAVMMLMTCFGAIGASAMTNEAAEAAAVEFNANIPDHSNVYANMSAKQWKNTKDALNQTLASILKKKDVKSTIYSDSTASAIVTALCKAIAPDTALVGMSTTKLAESLEKSNVYPNVSAYLKTVEKWEQVDASKLVWGITPGDKEAFITALSYAFTPNLGSVINLLTGVGSMSFLGNNIG